MLTPDRQSVLRRFAANWTNPTAKQLEVLAGMTAAYDRFVADGLGDRSFNSQLLGIGVEYKKMVPRFAQRVGEVNLAVALRRRGFALSSNDKGPDLLAIKNGHRIWLELITPEPEGVPAEWLSDQGMVQHFPHEAILLRYTAAIKEKAGKGLAWRKAGIIQPDEPYVIVVNDALLNRREGYLHSISGKPFVVEATLALGPWQLMMDRRTGVVTDRGFMHRPNIDKSKVNPGNTSTVPADTFVSDTYSHVSAVVGTSLRMGNVLDTSWPSALIHNPNSTARLPRELLPVEEEWDGELDEETYTIHRIA
jgi:hypothetical protein